ncbi:hypothetical protein GLYMA_08G057000v4 [Glycine max]|uniref:Uncharacterized protein n=1 Tax=Glycine max TaxID=3847 RepID=A0A0R0ISG5_SOYBN|nr:hypothetical protein GLYMA_08G057000v4 [Glycine max]|eukprot:XP_014633841.1 uncharacterized protein LOC100796275 isoform X1 [Glycine max]
MTATGVAVSLGLGTFSNCYCYPVPVKELLFSTTRIRNRSRKKRFGFGQKRFCVGAANANHEFDPELRSVLELATDSELYEIETILFGPSYLSPLLKSIPLAFTNTNTNDDLDRSMIGVDLGLRQQFIAALESRFFFLAADARSTLRGWRPSYRNVLLQIRKKLNIPCSTQLSTHDLELEIFLHLLHCNSTEEESSQGQATLQHGLSQWKVQSKVGAQDIPSILLKGGGVFTLSKIYQLLARKLSGKVLVEAANYQVKKELVKKGGQLAMINLESRAAMLAAKQGFLGAASRYLGFRSVVTLLGPVMYEGNSPKKRKTIGIEGNFPKKRKTIGFGERFWLILSFKCLEQIMLESCEQFMLWLRFESSAHIGCLRKSLMNSSGISFHGFSG